MRTEDDFESTPTFAEMSGGLRGLSERIDREVPQPRRASLVRPAPAANDEADFARAAHSLYAFEHGLDGLWPED